MWHKLSYHMSNMALPYLPHVAGFWNPGVSTTRMLAAVWADDDIVLQIKKN
jgi:hypothetical protein